MGNGIALVVLQAVAALDARRNGLPGSGEFSLVLIDQSRESLERLRGYLKAQLLKFAEKRIANLREWARDRKDLVENGEIIEAYVSGSLSLVRFDNALEGAREARVVFEAVFEDLQVKTDIYWKLKGICPKDAVFLSNTSSIPISTLDRSADLTGRIIGYHFYNPPAVQKLVEVITSPDTRPDVVQLAHDLGKVFEKTLVPAHDIAGFIGNGHFIREGLFALEKYQELRISFDGAQALFLINAVTQDFLVRPMGMFQLLDYVGLDVFQMILKIMGRYIPAEVFASEVIDGMLAEGIRGGQAGSGEQKDGFFQYERNRRKAVYDPDAKAYVPLDDERFKQTLEWLGPHPKGHASWSVLIKDLARQEKLAAYFAEMRKLDTPGARLSLAFLANSRRIAEGLVLTGVADSQEQITAVLMHGFYHLYGPVNPFLGGT